MKDAVIEMRWRPDQDPAEAWELRCRLGAPVGRVTTITVTGDTPAACVAGLQRRVIQCALGQKFADQETSLMTEVLP